MKMLTNRRMKRLSSVCLIAAMLFSLLCTARMVYATEDTPEKVTLALNSNVVSDDTIDLYVVDSVHYISLDDLCRLARCSKSVEGELIYVSQGFWRTSFDVVNNMFFDGYQVMHDLILKVSEDNYAVPALMFLNYFKADAFISEETLYCPMDEYTVWEALHVDYENSLLDVVDLYGGKGDVTLSLTLDVIMDLVMGDLTTPEGYMSDTFLQVLKVQLTDQSAVKEYQENSQKKLYEYIHSDKGEKCINAMDKIVSLASEPTESGIQHVIKSYYHAKERSFVETVYNAKLAGEAVDTASYGEKFYDAFVQKNKTSENVETIFGNADYLMLFIKAASNTATQMKYTESANNLIYDVMGQENVDYLGLSVEENDWFVAANNYGNMLNVAGTEIEAEAMRFCTDKVFWEKLVGTGVSSAAGISGGAWTLSLEAARLFTELFPLTGSLVDAYEADRRALLLSDVQQCVYMVADATNQRLSIQRTDTELYTKYIQAQQMYCRTSIAMYENLITMVNEFGQDKEYWTSFFQERIDKLAVSLYQLTTIQGDGVNKCLPMDLESFIVGQTARKLTQVNIYDNAANLIIEKRYYYNDDNQLTSEIERHVEYGSVVTQTYVYNSKGLLAEYHFESDWGFSCYYTYNEMGQLIEADEAFGKEWYEYDAEGRLIAIKASYNAGDYVTTNYYDENGMLFKADTEHTDNGGNKYLETTTYLYDAENRLIKEESEILKSKTQYNYDYTYENFTISEYSNNGERKSVTVTYYDKSGNEISLGFENPTFYADKEGYLAKVVDTYTRRGEIQTVIYEMYYDANIAVPLEYPTETSIPPISVIAHTYEEAQKLLYEYLGNIYGFEGLEVMKLNGNKFSMTIRGNPGPVYIYNTYTVDLDSGEVRSADTNTSRIICDLW